MSDGGKGSAPRPIQDYDEYSSNWDRIFGVPTEAPKTPCVGICTMGEGVDLCLGCGRRINEIMGWSWYDDESRERIMLQSEARLQALFMKGTDK
jgi:predicted Fe-S protein YdhL (DUF1289 family)